MRNEVIDITPNKWKDFLKDDVMLRNEDIHNLRDEGLKFPKDLAACNGDDVDAIIKNMKSRGKPLRAQSQKLLKYACAWFRTLRSTNFTIKDEHFSKEMFTNHAVAFKSLQVTDGDKKGIPTGLPALFEGAELLLWLERCIRVFARLVGHNSVPLGYIIRKEKTVGIDDGGSILPKRCYTEPTGSLRNMFIERHTHDDDAYDANNELVYDHLEAALKGNSMVSSLKNFRKTKDGRGAWENLMKQHGGEGRWEDAQ